MKLLPGSIICGGRKDRNDPAVAAATRELPGYPPRVMLPAMPHPRRFRSFSLRTLMVLFTMACIGAACLATQYRIVEARRAALEQWETVDRSVEVHSAAGATGKKLDGSDWPTVSWVRYQFGDVPIAFVRVRRFNEARIARVRRLFPEAEIFTGPEMHMGPASGTDERWDRLRASWNEEPLPIP